MLVYVSGPLSNGTGVCSLSNVKKAIRIADAVWAMGHVPVLPHLSAFWWHISDAARSRSHQEWLDYDFRLLEVCDAILYYAPSPGADLELAKARELGLEVYTWPNELPDASYRNKPMAYKAIWCDRLALSRLKNVDYGDDNITASGMVGIAVRLLDKAMRLKNVVFRGGAAVKDETLADTLLDIANYGDIGLLLQRGEWGLPWKHTNDDLQPHSKAGR